MAGTGQTWVSRGSDFVVKGDSRWVGMNDGGYLPIRLSIQNSGATRNITVQFSSLSDYSKQPTVRRFIQVEQNETARFTLLVPVVTLGDIGQFQVLYNGREYKKHTKNISLKIEDSNTSSYPSLLVISSQHVGYQRVDFSNFEKALDPSASSGPSGGYGGYAMTLEELRLAIEPTLLPENWLAYSGVDIVAVPLKTLTKMRRDARTALLQWVETGGTLIVYNVKQEVAKSEQLADALELKSHQHISQQWTNNNNVFSNFSHRFYHQGMIISFQDDDLFAIRKVDKEEFDARGRVKATSEWNYVLNTITPQRYSWRQRHGVSPRTMSDDFLKFLIPGVQGVPVYSFLFLITIFAIVIGPLNYFFFWRRKQLYLLIVTIPIIALMTSLSLFGYSIVAHGWGVKSRIRSVTFLNQQSNTAVSTARVALFAGMAPSGGLQFSPRTAVYPLWKTLDEFSEGTIDWSENQSFTTGWLRSRTHTQFLLTEHRTERGRLNIKNNADGKLDIENGLEWDIEAIVVIDEQGNVFSGKDLTAGASTQLQPATEIHSFVRLTRKFPPEYPEEYGTVKYESPDMRFLKGSSETSIQNINTINNNLVRGTKPPLQNRKTYYAFTKQNPGIGIGIEGTDERAGYHLLIGRY